MKKVLSLKLSAEEEEMVHKILKQGISPTRLMRDALLNYFNAVYQKDELVYQNQQEKNDESVYQIDETVYQHQLQQEEKPVYQSVYQNQQEKNDESVYQKDKMVYQQEEKTVYPVYQQKNQEKQHSDQYLQLYINQLSLRTQQLQTDIQDWKKRYNTQEQYLKETYTTFQTEYYAQVKDSIKRLDDKFDRIMFYLEETRKLGVQPGSISQSTSKEHIQETLIQPVINTKEKKNKPKKGWVFQMYRM
jgi:hypothetical protein